MRNVKQNILFSFQTHAELHIYDKMQITYIQNIHKNLLRKDYIRLQKLQFLFIKNNLINLQP